jgi:hypothetical protein
VRRISLGIALALLAAPIASCGGGGPAGASRPPSPPPRPTLTPADCAALTPAVRTAIAAAGGDGAMRLRRSAQPAPRLSGCFYTGRARVSFRIDTAHASRQRFSNRNVEAIQFSSDTPQRRPRNVPGVGDRGAEFSGATWTPASREMLAIRGNRLLILDLYVRRANSNASKSAAARLARGVYTVSSRR